MGILAEIKESGKNISDAMAGSRDYFDLATTNLSLSRALGKAIREHARGKLLDAGAGRKAYKGLLTPCCSSYESLDLSGEPGEHNHLADLQNTGLPPEQYDTVFCTQVIHHLPEPQAAVREIARLLKRGGKVILSAPHLSWLHNEPHDYWRFTSHGLRRLMENAGLRAISIEPVGGLICFVSYIPSTALLGLTWRAGPVFRAALWLNRGFIRAALLIDSAAGARSLFPTNYVVVAEK